MVIEFLDLKPRNPYLSLAIEESISRVFSRKDDFRCLVRFWSNPLSVVLGRTCRPEKNLKESFIKSFQPSMRKSVWQNSPMICRRPSGGGTVLHGPGNINYSVFLSLKHFPRLYDLKKSYKTILGLVQKSLHAQGFDCSQEGLSDLVLKYDDGVYRKISGNSQFRKNGILTHHGTLLTRANLIGSISEYLLHPPVEPDYREGRDHASFLGSLPDTFDITSFYSMLTSEIKRFSSLPEKRAVLPEERKEIFCEARRLIQSVYRRKDWILEGKAVYGAKVGEDIAS